MNTRAWAGNLIALSGGRPADICIVPDHTLDDSRWGTSVQVVTKYLFNRDRADGPL